MSSLFRCLSLVLVATTCLLLVSEPRANATVCGPAGLVAVSVGPFPAAAAIVTSIGGGVADHNLGWQVAGYVTAAANVAWGTAMIVLSDKSKGCPPDGVAMAGGVTNVVLGALALGLALYNFSKPKAPEDKPREALWWGAPSVFVDRDGRPNLHVSLGVVF